MDAKGQIIQALLSGGDPAEALRRSLFEKVGVNKVINKFDGLIDALTRVTDVKIATDSSIPYTNTDSLLADYDDINNIYEDYPQIKGPISNLVELIEARDNIKLDEFKQFN